MQKSLRSIAADQKCAAVAIAEGKVKKTGSGAEDRLDHNHNSSRGLKQKLDREQEGKNTHDGGKQPPPKMQTADTRKVSFASDSDLEDNFEDEYQSTAGRLRKKGDDAVDAVNKIATPIKLEFNLEHDTVVFHI
eukprot:15339191-Ditylum_brightwellii.AAC.1